MFKTVSGRYSGQVVSLLHSRWSSLGLSPGPGHCVVFLGKTLYFHTTLQVKTILVAMATKILELATKLELKSPAWRLKLRRRIESVSLIQ